MGTTTIQVDDETADELYERKRRGESYDDVISRLLEDDDRDGQEDVDEPRGFDAPEPPRDQGTLEDVDLEDGVVDVDVAIDSLDLPGSGSTLAARRDAVRACYDYLREHGRGRRSEFIDEIYPEHSARFGSQRGWWNAIGKDGLRELANEIDAIDPPGAGEHVWFFEKI